MVLKKSRPTAAPLRSALAAAQRALIAIGLWRRRRLRRRRAGCRWLSCSLARRRRSTLRTVGGIRPLRCMPTYWPSPAPAPAPISDAAAAAAAPTTTATTTTTTATTTTMSAAPPPPACPACKLQLYAARPPPPYPRPKKMPFRPLVRRGSAEFFRRPATGRHWFGRPRPIRTAPPARPLADIIIII